MNAGGHESEKMIFRTTGAYTAGKRFLIDNLRFVYSGNQAGKQWADDFDNLTADRYQTKLCSAVRVLFDTSRACTARPR